MTNFIVFEVNLELTLVQMIVIAICQEIPFTACNLFLNSHFYEIIFLKNEHAVMDFFAFETSKFV